MHLARKSLGRFFCGNTHRATGSEIYESRRDFSPIPEFQRALSQSASRHDGNGVRRATINLHEGYQALAIFSLWIIDRKLAQAKHSEADTENLPGTQMSVGLFCIAKIFIKRLHIHEQTKREGYFRRQRIPSLVISTTMPASVSSARI